MMDPQKHALEGDALPTTNKKPRTFQYHSHDSSPLFLLTREVMVGQVLDFCHRKDVATLMTIRVLQEFFRLDDSFCMTHGTELSEPFVEDDDDSSSLECCDCVLQDECRRCDECDELKDMEALFLGACGKMICEGCKTCLDCNDCGKEFHCDCQDCGVTGLCDYCDDFLCGSCQILKKCEVPGCNNPFEACSDCVKKYWASCSNCEKVICQDEECMERATPFLCEICRHQYCSDCCHAFANGCHFCGLRLCTTCEQKGYHTIRTCHICKGSLCPEGGCGCSIESFWECADCGKGVCDMCVYQSDDGSNDDMKCKHCKSNNLQMVFGW